MSTGENTGPKGLMIWVMVKKPKNNKQRELLHQTREGQGHKSLLTHLTCSWASQVVSEERSPNLGTEHSGAVGFSPISGSREGQATHQGTPGTKKKATLSQLDLLRNAMDGWVKYARIWILGQGSTIRI